MTVNELIEELRKLPPDATVVLAEKQAYITYYWDIVGIDLPMPYAKIEIEKHR